MAVRTSTPNTTTTLRLALLLLLAAVFAAGSFRAAWAQAGKQNQAPAPATVVCPDCTLLEAGLKLCSFRGNATRPQSSEEWAVVSQQMATCLCPWMASDNAYKCLNCISTDFPTPSRTLFTGLLNACEDPSTLSTAAQLLQGEVYEKNVAEVTDLARPPLSRKTSAAGSLVHSALHVGVSSFVSILALTALVLAM